MFALTESSTMWINITNVVLGLATAVCLAIVGYTVIREVVSRVTQKTKVRAEDPAHVFNVPELGLTMTDGGEKLYDDDERAFG